MKTLKTARRIRKWMGSERGARLGAKARRDAIPGTPPSMAMWNRNGKRNA